MTELTDAAYDAHAVIGPEIPRLEQELGDIPGFAERIQLIEKRLIRVLGGDNRLDPVALAANRLFASNGIHRVAAMATASGLSPRQFERRFLAQVGVPPKLYARIIRFNAALDHKLRSPTRAWSCIASDQNYYDQMHLVHDCRAFTGESPSRFLAQLEGLPAFHTFFATHNRARDTGVTVCQTSHPYYLATPAFAIILDVTPLLHLVERCGRSRVHHVRRPSRTSPDIPCSARRAFTSAISGELFMNRTLVAMLAVTVLSGCTTQDSATTTTPPAFSADDESAVRALVNEFANTWNRHDMNAMHELDTEDVEWVNAVGPKATDEHRRLRPSTSIVRAWIVEAIVRQTLQCRSVSLAEIASKRAPSASAQLARQCLRAAAPRLGVRGPTQSPELDMNAAVQETAAQRTNFSINT